MANVAAAALVKVGACVTMTVKPCVAFGSVPFVAVSATGKSPPCVGVPDSSPAGDSVRPLGSTPAVTLTVGGGKPVISTWNVVPGVFSANVAVFALVIAGGAVTRTVKLCVAFGSVPLVADRGGGKDALSVAVRANSPADDNVRPGGSVPVVTLTVGVGKPVIVTWNVVPAMFSPNVAVFTLVIAGGALTRTVKLCVAFGSVPLVAVSVTGKEPNCVGVPDTNPAHHTITPF